MNHDLTILAAMAGGFLLLWLFTHKRLGENKKQLQESFKALSFDALDQASKAFLQLAETHLQKYQEGAKLDLEGKHKAIEASLEPLKSSMKKLDEQQRELEKKREGAYAGLQKQLEQMMASDAKLVKETAELGASLRSPNVRGSWGEVHLRRVVELAGLLSHCDFFEQVSLQTPEKTIRPDMVVRLPGERHIAIDAKTPLNAYLEAQKHLQSEEFYTKQLKEHAASLRKHIKELSSKEYWKVAHKSPEYVILFLPAEAFFSSALQVDPALIEVGADQNIVIATPTTLIAILRSVAFSWKQEALSKSAAEIAKAGAEVYERLSNLSEYWAKVGRQLSTVVESYNQSIASFETRLIPSVKKLKEFSALTKEVPVPEQIEKIVRQEKEVSIS